MTLFAACAASLAAVQTAREIFRVTARSREIPFPQMIPADSIIYEIPRKNIIPVSGCEPLIISRDIVFVYPSVRKFLRTPFKEMSKGMIEKLKLILVMSREADLYVLDEPLGGVDPATRDYILDTILSNFKNGASIIISTHLIQDIERILDDVIFVDKGKIILTGSCDELRKKHNESIDEIFRRMFKC
jgi:ABC-type phosphate transport system ATPase subunit